MSGYFVDLRINWVKLGKQKVLDQREPLGPISMKVD